MQDTVYSDEKWVRFILNQLSANAVKYRTKQPVLRISTHKQQDQVVRVVEDNGIGIAASDLPRIFEKEMCIRDRGSSHICIHSKSQYC